MRKWTCRAVVCALACVAGLPALAAQRGGEAPAAPPQTPRASAPIDLTGYWVSIVNEDWRWRMVTPPVGDFASVPLNPAGQKIAKSWDPSTDGSCLAYGAAGLMRMPTRLHITWESDDVLRIDTDAGRQTRRLMFTAARAPGKRSLQGFSRAEWERPGRGGRGGAAGAAAQPPPGGTLRVLTTELTGGWLRRNGVPYSENATMTEFFDRFAAPNGDEWLVVTTIVSDPTYLTQDFVTSTHFRREPGGDKWSPSPCTPAR